MFSLLGRYGGLAVVSLLCCAFQSLGAEPVSTDLHAYLGIVLQGHPELRAADAKVVAAEARAEGLARPLYNPELEVGSERAQSQTYTLGLSQTVDLSGKRSARRASGSAELASANAERAALRQSIATEALKSLAELYGRSAAASLAQQRLDLLERFADIADRQYRAGDVGVLDRDLAALARAEAIALAGRAQLELLKAQQALDTATRHPGLAPPPLPESPPDAERLGGDYEALASTLPSVRLAKAKTEIALAEGAIARSQAHADPTIGLRGGREQDRNGANGEALVGLQVTIPLFLRNNFRAEIAVADAQASASGIEAQAAYDLAITRMKAAATQYQRSLSAWRQWTSLSSARIDSSVELLDKVWRVREISAAEYLVQLRQLLDGRAAGEELRAQTWMSWSEWLDASGLWQAWLDATPTPSSNPSASTGN